MIAEDSGLEVRVLAGRPGIRSARYAGSAQDDRANLTKLLRVLKGVPASRRQARFVCVTSVAAGGKLLRVFRGVCRGSIAFEEKGRDGFGYDPIFIPAGSRKSAAQLSAARKDRISHRGQAARALAAWTKRGLGAAPAG